MCEHQDVTLINPYETIRKYLCEDCGAVMMCSCDRDYGEEYLPHQLRSGTDLHAKEEFVVTAGFQEDVCEECRLLPITAYPKAQLYGNTSKIRRFYWRELSIETTKMFGAWAKSRGFSDWKNAWRENAEKHKEIERQALIKIKELHRVSPKYNYSEKTQQEVIDEYGVEVENLEIKFVKTGDKPKGILFKGAFLSAEQFAIKLYEERGYQAIHMESVPFHVLFGTFLWPLIQDPKDGKARHVVFGRRDNWQSGAEKDQIWTLMPQDFGSMGYGIRRDEEIVKHLSSMPKNTSGLLELFDISSSRSSDLRQYLWAHEVESVAKARLAIELIPVDKIVDILNYLLRDYWKRYLGWPDLIIANEKEYCFVEVKASKDKLSETQKSWISDNHKITKMPFKILKLHKFTEQKV